MNSKIRILYVVSSLKKCGPTNQLYGIIKHLDEKKFNVTVLTLFKEKDNSDISLFINNKINVNSLDLNNNKNLCKVIQKLKKYNIDKDIDIVHSCGLAADFCCCFLRNRIHVSTIRNYAYFDYISAYGVIYGKIMIFLNKWAIEHTNYPVCCSKSIKKMYEKKIRNKLYHIKNGVDIEKFKFAPELKKNMRKELSLPEDKLICIVSGSLCERKDPLFIINCFLNIKFKEKVCLLFIGEGDLYAECMKYESEHILLRGAVTNVNDYLCATDVYISASKSEGLPNSVLEAAACGLKLLLSAIPQHIEIFENNIELAKYFELNNKTEFINYLHELLYIVNENNCQVAKYIENNFSSKKNSEKYSDLYRWILHKEFDHQCVV